ncbi:hypothetical protein RHIZ_19315 [Rhizobium skierniewicense]|uniref:hypothetical protein n=1 Tax=Rhizobium TaxID=379 RepID=UPI001FAC6A43|nr:MULTISPECIES: hypothetical protein [Rhizobium]MCI9868115.1 hypothetical protein [Rhizobium skierniewicense]
MPVTYSSSIGSHLSIVSGDPDAEQPLEIFEQSISTDAAMGQLSSQINENVGLSATADTTALGTNTTAQLTGLVTATAGSCVTSTHANIEAYAAAHSDGDFALATTYIDVVFDGSGSYLSISGIVSRTEVEIDTTTSSSYSRFSFVVTDFTGSVEHSDADESDLVIPGSGESPGPADDNLAFFGHDVDDDPVGLDGNMTFFDFTVTAYGENTTVGLVIDSLVMEHTMSNVILLILLEIG